MEHTKEELSSLIKEEKTTYGVVEKLLPDTPRKPLEEESLKDMLRNIIIVMIPATIEPITAFIVQTISLAFIG